MSGKEAESKRKGASRSTSRWMVAALVIAAAIFVVQFIAPQTLGEQVRRHVEAKLREHYPHLQVSVGRGRVDPKVGVILDDIRIDAPQDQEGVTVPLVSRRGRPLIAIRQIVVETQTEIERLIDRKMPLVTRRVIVRGVVAHAWMESASEVSLNRLWPPPKFGDVACPRMEIRDAKVLLSAADVPSRPLELSLDQALALRTGGGMNGSSDSMSITAVGKSSFSDRFQLRATTGGKETQVRAELSGVRFDGDLTSRLPQTLRKLLQPVAGLELAFNTQLVAKLPADGPPQFLARTTVNDGMFRDPRSSIPLKGIRGLVTCDHNGVSVSGAQAKWGDALITFATTETIGFQMPPQVALELSASNLMLDSRLGEIIPPQLQQVWQNYRPRGLVDITDARLRLIGGKLESEAKITCKGVDISFVKFPYPVQHITGTFAVGGGRVKSELMSGWVGGSLMTCLFDVPSKPKSPDPGLFSFAMDGPIAIDTELLQALTPRREDTTQLETFIRSLHPFGSVHVKQGAFRTDADGSKHQHLELKVTDGTMRFEKFPYPLYNVSGDIVVDDQLVALDNFQGSNSNGGAIRCDGTFRIPKKGAPMIQRMLDLYFSATRVALDESLRSSLPRSSQQTWDALWPSGILDSLEIRLTIDKPGLPIDLNILGQQFEASQLGNDTLRLHPTSVPYRLDIVEGLVRYQDGEVRIDAIRAEHGQSSVSADGRCEKLPTGRWLLTMNVHNGSRLIPDSELISALPMEMRGAMKGLNLKGPIRFDGQTQTLLSNETNPMPSFVWDLDLQLEGNRFGEVGSVHALRGEVSVKGKRDTQGLQAEGEVKIDSMHVDDLQITQVSGPYRIRDDELELGQLVTGIPTSRPIQGRLFDGTLLLNGRVRLSDASFDVRLGLNDAKLPRLLAELGHTGTDLTGSLDANMSLEGLLGTTDLLSGKGKATVENANLYQLPFLVQLLNVLSVTPTEDVAFTNADVDYTLVEDQIVFNDLKLWGSLIGLHGAGTLDRRRQLDLTFNTRVSPKNTFTKLIRPLSDRRYTLWTVDVRGPLDDPIIERRALEGVGEALDRLFQGMNTSTEPNRRQRSAGIGRSFLGR